MYLVTYTSDTVFFINTQNWLIITRGSHKGSDSFRSTVSSNGMVLFYDPEYKRIPRF